MPPEIYAVLGKLISTLKMNYRKNPFLLKSLSLINSSSSFSFPKYLGVSLTFEMFNKDMWKKGNKCPPTFSLPFLVAMSL